MDKPIDHICFVIKYHLGGGDEYIPAEFDPPGWLADSAELGWVLEEDNDVENLKERLESLMDRLLKDPELLINAGFTAQPKIEYVWEPIE